MKYLALFLLLLAACTPAAAPTAAPSATAILTPTSTPVPPLVAHEWTQSEPLITFSRSEGGLRGFGFWDAYPIDFTLLPSGDLYVLRWDEHYSAAQILATTLSRQATCNLLNSIDQAGFFDYDPSSYTDPSRYMTAYPDSLHPGERLMPGPTDVGFTRISVQAWRANTVALYNLTGSLSVERENQLKGTPAPVFPNILPAIRDTFRLLDQYQPPDMHALEPGRLGVWLMGAYKYDGTHDYMEWPLKSSPLAAAASEGRFGGGEPSMILTGADATRVYDALGGNPPGGGTAIREGDKVYLVFARPLLPNEFNANPLPEVSLSCSPADGWVQAP